MVLAGTEVLHEVEGGESRIKKEEKERRERGKSGINHDNEGVYFVSPEKERAVVKMNCCVKLGQPCPLVGKNGGRENKQDLGLAFS